MRVCYARCIHALRMTCGGTSGGDGLRNSSSLASNGICTALRAPMA